jgi:hypothetical protein
MNGWRDFTNGQPASKRRLLTTLLCLVMAALNFGCGLQSERRELPADVQSAIATIADDLAAEQYEKIYNEADELWKQDSTLEQSVADLKTLRAKLGKAKSRNLHAATEQHNSGGALKGRAYIVTYQTNFENGEGMEIFTLVERNNQWLLARYRVNSTALK